MAGRREPQPHLLREQIHGKLICYSTASLTRLFLSGRPRGFRRGNISDALDDFLRVYGRRKADEALFWKFRDAPVCPQSLLLSLVDGILIIPRNCA